MSFSQQHPLLQLVTYARQLKAHDGDANDPRRIEEQISLAEDVIKVIEAHKIPVTDFAFVSQLVQKLAQNFNQAAQHSLNLEI